MPIYLLLLVFIAFLLLSAFFSGSETAFLNLKNNNNKIPADLFTFSQKTKRLLIGLLFGNTIVNILIAFLGAYFIHQIEGQAPSTILRFIETTSSRLNSWSWQKRWINRDKGYGYKK